jgi:hypothetical protein
VRHHALSDRKEKATLLLPYVRLLKDSYGLLPTPKP